MDEEDPTKESQPESDSLSANMVTSTPKDKEKKMWTNMVRS